MSRPVPAPAVVWEHYEALRREATTTGPDGPRGPGLALFLARGLPAWLAALAALLPLRPAAGAVGELSGPPVPAPLPARRELTTVLAGMVLACTQPREGHACPAR